MEEPVTGFTSPESTEELRRQTFDALRKHNVVLAATIADPVTDSYKQAMPERIMKGCIAPLNDPAWQKNYNAAKPPVQQSVEDARTATVKLHLGPDRPSKLVLPVRFGGGR